MSGAADDTRMSGRAARPRSLRWWDTGVVTIVLFQSVVVVLDGAPGFTSALGIASESARTALVLAPGAAPRMSRSDRSGRSSLSC